jgi:hypothetical protein
MRKWFQKYCRPNNLPANLLPIREGTQKWQRTETIQMSKGMPELTQETKADKDSRLSVAILTTISQPASAAARAEIAKTRARASQDADKDRDKDRADTVKVVIKADKTAKPFLKLPDFWISKTRGDGRSCHRIFVTQTVSLR